MSHYCHHRPIGSWVIVGGSTVRHPAPSRDQPDDRHDANQIVAASSAWDVVVVDVVYTFLLVFHFDTLQTRQFRVFVIRLRLRHFGLAVGLKSSRFILDILQ